MGKENGGSIIRSCGIVVGGYIVGGGYKGITELLDKTVQKEAAILRDHFHQDVTIRFNSNRRSGGAWLVDSQEDHIGCNDSIGLSASLYNSKLKGLDGIGILQFSGAEIKELLRHPDGIQFGTAINIKKTVNSVDVGSSYMLLDTEHRTFQTLDEAVSYLFAHVSGLRQVQKNSAKS